MTKHLFTLAVFSATVFASFTALPEAAAQTNANNTTNLESTKQVVTQAEYDAAQAKINDLKAQLAAVDTKAETQGELIELTNLKTLMTAKGSLRSYQMNRYTQLMNKYSAYFAMKNELATLEPLFANMEVQTTTAEANDNVEPGAGNQTNDNTFGTTDETNNTLENSTEISGNQPQ